MREESDVLSMVRAVSDIVNNMSNSKQDRRSSAMRGKSRISGVLDIQDLDWCLAEKRGRVVQNIRTHASTTIYNC